MHGIASCRVLDDVRGTDFMVFIEVVDQHALELCVGVSDSTVVVFSKILIGHFALNHGNLTYENCCVCNLTTGKGF